MLLLPLLPLLNLLVGALLLLLFENSLAFGPVVALLLLFQLLGPLLRLLYLIKELLDLWVAVHIELLFYSLRLLALLMLLLLSLDLLQLSVHFAHFLIILTS